MSQYQTQVYDTEKTEYLPAQEITVNYVFDSETPIAHTMTIPRSAQAWEFVLAQGEPVVPGSVVLQAGSEYWYDNKNGEIVRDWSTATGVGEVIGTLDYKTGKVKIDDYIGRPPSVTLTPVSVLVGEEFNVLVGATFRTRQSPLRPSGFTLRGADPSGNQFTANDNAAGDLTGTAVGGTGTVDYDDGLIDISFSTPIEASTLFYNAVSFKSVPLSAEILGLDPVRLPVDGRVPIFRDADILILTHTAKDEITTPTAGATYNAGRTELYSGWIEDSTGTRLRESEYTLDKEAGTVTLADPFSAVDDAGAALISPLYFVHRIDDMALCTEARIDGKLTLAQPLPHAYPVGSWVASALHFGNLQARVKGLVSYTTDVGYGETGTETNSQYNAIAYPIAIDNRGSVPERWKIKFTSSTAFELYGEERGLVGTGSTLADFSPVNPETLTPYFTINSNGWGTGWAVGNTLYFDTEAAAGATWFIRTVLPGAPTEENDLFQVEIRGDHN